MFDKAKKAIFLTFFFLSFIILCKNVEASNLPMTEYIEKYVQYDNSINEGRGYCTSRDSAQLAWGESYLLQDYIMLYSITKDKNWLHKITLHFDQMICTMLQKEQTTTFKTYSVKEVENMVEQACQIASNIDMNRLDENGYPTWHETYPGWSTARYSAALVKVKKIKSKMAEIIADPERITDFSMARLVTGHDYTICFGDNLHYGVGDATINTMIKQWEEFKYDKIRDIPGVTLRVEWTPEKGDSFLIKTIEQKQLQYVVHDGMILYPIAKFIEIVLKDENLKQEYGERAELYKKLIAYVFVKKWEKYWVEFPTDSGTYKFTESPAEEKPGFLIPINQANAIGRVFLVMQDKLITDDPFIRKRAAQIAKYFKNYLKKRGDGWIWNYWECGDPSFKFYSEDASHASIDIGFAIEASKRGIEFDKTIMMGFTHTLIDFMWNGLIEAPRFGERVDTKEGNDIFHLRGWIELCQFNPFIWDICANWFKFKGEPVELIPTLLYAQEILRK